MKKLTVVIAIVFLCGASAAFGWHDKTHMAIANAAGYENWYNAAGADITKTKAGNIEATNHWYNNDAGVEVTDNMVFDQIVRYNDPKDAEGHLYGAIMASLRDYMKSKQPGKYAEYHMAFCAHYIGDLSMPMHNAPHKGFFEKHHTINDATIEFSAMDNIGLIKKGMYDITINSEEDVAREIARIANISHSLALKLEKESRDMTKDESYSQVAHSASLLKAVLLFASSKK